MVSIVLPPECDRAMGFCPIPGVPHNVLAECARKQAQHLTQISSQVHLVFRVQASVIRMLVLSKRAWRSLLASVDGFAGSTSVFVCVQRECRDPHIVFELGRQEEDDGILLTLAALKDTVEYEQGTKRKLACM